MSGRRKSYSAKFKTKLMLELLREEEAAAAIDSRYEVTVQTLNQWKKKLLENTCLDYDNGEATREYRQKIEKFKKHKIAIQMNSKGRNIGNITIERLFRTLKYEELNVIEYENVKALKKGIRTFIKSYNFNRLHSALKFDHPMNVYLRSLAQVA